MKLQPNPNPLSSESLRAEVQCPRKDGAAAATMTPAIPALRNQSSEGGPGDVTSEALSSKADNGLSQTATNLVPTPATNSDATSTVGPQVDNSAFNHREANDNTEDIVGGALGTMTNADSATSKPSERISTRSGSTPTVSGNRGDMAAAKESTGLLTLGAAEKIKASVHDRGDHQRLDSTANPQTQTPLELGSQAGNQPKSVSSIQVIERPFEKYSKVGNSWQPATTADRTQTELKAAAKMHDRSESSDTDSTLSSEDSQESTDDESSEEEQHGPNLQSRTSRVAQPAEECAQEDDTSGDSAGSEEDLEKVDAAKSEDDNDPSGDSSDSEDDEYPEQEGEEKKNVLVQKWLTAASTGAPEAISKPCNICP
ncbi:MAG: hypothetical protein Q9207_005519 [Kuettlingeria erythrocarpa]